MKKEVKHEIKKKMGEDGQLNGVIGVTGEKEG